MMRDLKSKRKEESRIWSLPFLSQTKKQRDSSVTRRRRRFHAIHLVLLPHFLRFPTWIRRDRRLKLSLFDKWGRARWRAIADFAHPASNETDENEIARERKIWIRESVSAHSSLSECTFGIEERRDKSQHPKRRSRSPLQRLFLRF